MESGQTDRWTRAVHIPIMGEQSVRNSPAMSRYYKPTMGRAHSRDTKGRLLANDTVKRLQLEFGAYMASLREARGMTQKQVADLVGVTDNHVSDIENGVRKISPERYEQFAKVFGVDRHEFGKRVLFHYDPFAYKLLFGGKRIEAVLSAVPERIAEAYGADE